MNSPPHNISLGHPHAPAPSMLIFMAESKEELKNLLVKVKEESKKAGLKHSHQKTKIMASSPITS